MFAPGVFRSNISKADAKADAKAGGTDTGIAADAGTDDNRQPSNSDTQREKEEVHSASRLKHSVYRNHGC